MENRFAGAALKPSTPLAVRKAARQGKASLPDDTAARVPYDQRSAGRLAGDDDATRESNTGHRRGGYIMVLPRKLHVF